jgi:hypothetical protein
MSKSFLLLFCKKEVLRFLPCKHSRRLAAAQQVFTCLFLTLTVIPKNTTT